LNLRENALRCILLELPGKCASIDLLWITRLESNKIAGNWLQVLKGKSLTTPSTLVVGFLALAGISRREYEWEGGGGGGRRRRWCAVIAGKVEAAALQYPRGYCSREQGGGDG
jgi:hypothetical protein